MTQDDDLRDRRRSPLLSWVGLAVGVAVLVAAVAVIATTSLAPAHSASAASALPPHMTRAMRNVVQFDPLSGDPVPAPSFSLTDQHGRPVSLDRFHGKAVVLTFDDDRCEDLCTFLAEDIRAADRDLGSAVDDVVFVGVNANPYYPEPSDVEQWTQAQGLDGLDNWYFATGTPAALAKAAADYGVPIERDPDDRTVEHGTQIFFIGPGGTEQAMGAFGTDSANTTLFGHALAQGAMDVLPASQRTAVAAPDSASDGQDGARLGSHPAPVTLPRLSGTGAASTAHPGDQYTVVNFWSSTCAACRRELPALETVYRSLGSRAHFLGIDVADTTGAARSRAAAAGVTYPLAADADGTTAARFGVTGLPFTVILDPHGTVVVRHPGALTTDQLAYLVQSLTQTHEHRGE